MQGETYKERTQRGLSKDITLRLKESSKSPDSGLGVPGHSWEQVPFPRVGQLIVGRATILKMHRAHLGRRGKEAAHLAVSTSHILLEEFNLTTIRTFSSHVALKVTKYFPFTTSAKQTQTSHKANVFLLAVAILAKFSEFFSPKLHKGQSWFSYKLEEQIPR